MNKEEIIETMFKRILGEIEPVGETNVDNKRYENFYMYEILLNLIKTELIECLYYKDRTEYSMKRAGEKAYEILKELYGEIRNYIEE